MNIKFLAPKCSLRGVGSAVYGITFLVGLVFVWTGLNALILGGGGAGRGLPTLAAGFCVWLALALVAGARRR